VLVGAADVGADDLENDAVVTLAFAEGEFRKSMLSTLTSPGLMYATPRFVAMTSTSAKRVLEGTGKITWGRGVAKRVRVKRKSE